MAPPPSLGPDERSGSLLIDCDDCRLQDSGACADCVVTYLCGVEAEVPMVVDLDAARALRLFDQAGLAPPLRHRRRSG